MANEHIAQMVFDVAKANPEHVAFRQKVGERYVDVRWKEAHPRLEAIAAGLLAGTPLSPNACVTILGNTSLDWILADFAALSLGLRTVPVYASLLSEEVGYMHVDTGAELAIVENAAQLEKVRAMRGGFTFFEVRYDATHVALKGKIIVLDPTGVARADDWESLAEVEARGRERLDSLRAEMSTRLAAIRRGDLATFTYTSGTTGPPKAVMQTHDNMLSMLESVDTVGYFDDTTRRHGLFLFLPAAHSFGRLIELAGPFFRAPLVLSSVPTLAADLQLARPAFFPGAPRVFEKMMGKIQSAVASSPSIRRALVGWAIGVGRETIPFVTRGKAISGWLGLRFSIANKLVLSKLRARLGLDNATILLSGSAPLRSDVHEFFLSLGFRLIEAYGLTETCPGLTSNRPDDMRVGTVGQAFSGVEIKIAEDGEILARGRNITSGYLNREDATREAFDADGWFHTGDLGAIDAEGFVRITGRKKELFKTSGGKYIAPVKLEAKLKALPFIQEAVVIGDGRNFCTVVFSLDPEGLAEFAQREGASAAPNDAKVLAALDAHVKRVNTELASFESIKAFRVAPGPFSIDGGEFTPSLKVKRRVVAEKYGALIESMYGAGA